MNNSFMPVVSKQQSACDLKISGILLNSEDGQGICAGQFKSLPGPIDPLQLLSF